MLKFYYSGAPNPVKVALFLEEAGLPYEAFPVDTRKGDQHKPDYLAINPNAKVPAIVDGDAVVFDSKPSCSISPRRRGKFLRRNAEAARRIAVLDDVRRYRRRPFSGQSVHFRNYAPEKIPYAINRYVYEAQRHFGILNDRLGKQKYMVGDTYTIVDMDVWGWARMVPWRLARNAWAKFPNLKRLVDEVSARPAAARAIALKDAMFKTEFDDEAQAEHVPPHARKGGVNDSSLSPQSGERALFCSRASARRASPRRPAPR